MNSIKNSVILFFICLIGLCHADITDYLRGTDRTFNAIEGKVLDFNFYMDEKDYSKFIECAQMNHAIFFGKYHTQLPEELNFERNLKLNITVGDEVYSFSKVNFKFGGNFGRTCQKIGYNIKFKNKESFLGRKSLRIRPNFFDNTHLKSKIASDLLSKWDYPTVQESFCRLYINGRYLGFYSLMDAIKPNWVKAKYHLPEDEDVKTLYNCGKINMDFCTEATKYCNNEKDEYLNYTLPLAQTVDEICSYTTIDQLKTKINVENVRKQMIAEYLYSSIDQMLVGAHNFHLYQKSDGIWDIIPHDFDSIFVGNINNALNNGMPVQLKRQNSLSEYATAPFEDWYVDYIKKPFVDIIYYNDKKQFRKVLKEMLITGFNPDELYPRIDELANFIAPYVKEDITPDENGILPGYINRIGKSTNETYSMEFFWDSINSDNVQNKLSIKHFIELKFDSVCKYFNFNKKEILREARNYRKKRETKILMDEVKAEIDLKKQEFNEFEKIVNELNKQLKEKKRELEKSRKNIDSLKRKLDKLRNKYDY